MAGELWTRNWDTHPLPLMQPGGAKRPSPSPSPKGGAAQKNKRKWQRQVMEKDSDSSENDDPQAKQKRMQRAQRFGAGHAVGAVPQSKPAKVSQLARAGCGWHSRSSSASLHTAHDVLTGAPLCWPGPDDEAAPQAGELLQRRSRDCDQSAAHDGR